MTGFVRILGLTLAMAALAGSPKPARAASPEAMAYLDNALADLRSHHINRDKVDWPALIASAHRAAADARTPGDTHAAIRAAIVALGEKHTFLVEPRPQPAVPTKGAVAARTDDNALPKWRIVGDRVAEVWLPALNTITGAEGAGGRYTAALEDGLRAHAEAATCGWIVDLRDNRGGNMWPMLAGLDPLLGPDPFGHFVTAGGTLPWVRTADHGIIPSAEGANHVAPRYSVANSDRPLALLLGPMTASTGEMVALALIGRADVRSFGQQTAGYTTANEPHRLSDGAVLAVTVSKAAARDGVLVDGQLAPDVEVPAEDAEAAALAWLKQACADAR